MKQFDVHVCLVSDQALPNFIPVLAKDFRPQRVILLATDKMKQKAAVLAEVMKRRCQVKTDIVDLHDEYDMRGVDEKIFDLLLGIDKEKVALNVTGGTKLMSIAAYTRFHAEGYPVFYFTAKDNRVLLLDDGSDGREFVLQPEKMKIEDYLELHGYPVRRGYALERRLQYPHLNGLRQELVSREGSLAEELTALNYEISQADKNSLTVNTPKAKNPQNLDYLLQLLEDAGLLKHEGNKLRFSDDAAKKYVGGGWFEDYVFETVKNIDGVQDAALNVQIENAGAQTHQHNELDVAVLANNVLHVLECKTVNIANGKKQADDILYKLESLKKLGGLRTQAALVSYRETGNAGAVNTIRDRAHGAQIELLERKDLKGLKTLLSKWMNGR